MIELPRPHFSFVERWGFVVEKEASKAMIGTWNLGDKYISPKEWSRMEKGR